jgi:hypothetical protein
MKVGVALGVLLLITASTGEASAGARTQRGSQQIGVLKADGTYKLAGEDAPIHYVIESFLLDAAGYYDLDDPESYQDFCEDFGIESAWPSASGLGTLIHEIFAEYKVRHQEAPSAASREAVGMVWKPRALGEEFGRLYGDLRSDGLRLSFDIFLEVIELQIREDSGRFGTDPFLRGELEAGARLFWMGAAKTNSEAAESLMGGDPR